MSAVELVKRLLSEEPESRVITVGRVTLAELHELATRKTGAALNRGRSKQDYETPPDFMDAVRRQFGSIGFDLAAAYETAKAPRFFGEEANALVQNWSEQSTDWLWLNPPFGRITPWVVKCEMEASQGARILLLSAASVGARWYDRHVRPFAYSRALAPRLKFVGHKQAFPKDLMLSVYGTDEKPGFRGTWNWKSEIFA